MFTNNTEKTSKSINLGFIYLKTIVLICFPDLM